MPKFYFTFGFGQKFEGCYTIIEAEDYEKAREEMFKRFGDKWAFQYTEEQWQCEDGMTQAEFFDLKEVK